MLFRSREVMQLEFPVDMGSVIIRRPCRICRTQYFWDANGGWVNETQPDGSTGRTTLKSAEQAREKAWLASAIAIAIGLDVEALA